MKTFFLQLAVNHTFDSRDCIITREVCSKHHLNDKLSLNIVYGFASSKGVGNSSSYYKNSAKNMLSLHEVEHERTYYIFPKCSFKNPLTVPKLPA